MAVKTSSPFAKCQKWHCWNGLSCLTHNSIHLHKDQNGNSSPVEIRFQCHGSGKDISRPSSFHFSLSRCEDRDYNFSLKRSSSFCISQRALLWMMRGNFEFSHYALTKEPSKRPTDDITTCIHKMTSNFNIQPWICSSWKFLEIDWDKRTRIFLPWEKFKLITYLRKKATAV